MGKLLLESEGVLRAKRREAHKNGETIVRNKKTGATYIRTLTTHASINTEARLAARAALSERSHKVKLWMQSNDPMACPPNGSPEYQKIMNAYKRQNLIKRFYNFVMSRIDRL